MPETKNPSTTTFVIGAGELGLAVINGLLKQNPTSAGSISVLLRPPVEVAGEQVTRQLQDKGLKIVHGDLAAETVDGLAAIFTPFDTVVCCTGFVGGPGTQRKITTAVLQAGVALLKGSCGFGEEHEVVGQDTQDEFASLSLMSSGGECGAEATFVLAEATLDSLNANDKCLRSGQRGWWE